MKIGLSLSLCVRDIASGAVNEADVTVIVANTCATSYAIFERVLEQYSQIYWSKFAPEACSIAKSLYISGRIVQPRVEDPDYMQHKAVPHWIDVPPVLHSQDPRIAT